MKSNSENWVGKDRYVGKGNGGSTVKQWSDRVSDEFGVHKEAGIQVKEVGKANGCKECRQVIQQGRTHRTYSGSEHLLPGPQREDRNRCYWRSKMDSNLGDAMSSMIQSRNRLEDRRGENDQMPRGVQ